MQSLTKLKGFQVQNLKFSLLTKVNKFTEPEKYP